MRRQVSEAGNQASNGKAELLHQTEMNTARSMIFGSGLPLRFWDEAAEFASYILNRSPTRENENRASPIKVLTGSIPKLTDIVFFAPRSPQSGTRNTRPLIDVEKQNLILARVTKKRVQSVVYQGSRGLKNVTFRHIKTISDDANTELVR